MQNTAFQYYSVDASVMIKLKDMLPFDLFGTAWDEISRLVSDGRWKIFENVIDEIHGDTLKKWFRDNEASIVKFNPAMNDYTNKLMAELDNNKLTLIDPMSLKNNADPFVVMLALYLEERDLVNLKGKTSDTKCCVLTEERPRPKRINIPAVCDFYDISYMNLFDFMRHHGWNISLQVKNP